MHVYLSIEFLLSFANVVELLHRWVFFVLVFFVSQSEKQRFLIPRLAKRQRTAGELVAHYDGIFSLKGVRNNVLWPNNLQGHH